MNLRRTTNIKYKEVCYDKQTSVNGIFLNNPNAHNQVENFQLLYIFKDKFSNL